MLAAIVFTGGLAALFAASMLLPRTRIDESEEGLVERINALLPQTQCRRCTFEGCKPYSTAIARGEADINQCPPGGDATAHALATLMKRESKSVDAQFGVMPARPEVAWI